MDRLEEIRERMNDFSPANYGLEAMMADMRWMMRDLARLQRIEEAARNWRYGEGLGGRSSDRNLEILARTIDCNPSFDSWCDLHRLRGLEDDLWRLVDSEDEDNPVRGHHVLRLLRRHAGQKE